MTTRTPIRAVAGLMALLLVAGCDPAQPSGFLDAVGIEAEMRQAVATTPFPPGADPGRLTVDDRSGSYEVGLGRSMIEFRAMCAWYREWLGTREADLDRARRAAAVIAVFPEWATYRLYMDDSGRDHVDRLVSAVREDQPALVGDELRINC
jgi:hypothetical protein